MEPPKGSRGQAAGSVTVWVCQQEKVVSGMTRRTTCAEVVRALLAEQRRISNSGSSNSSSNGNGKAPGVTGCGVKSPMGHPDAYGLVEKWRGYERVLPGRTRLLRLWTAWGAERSWVRFVLVKKDAFAHGAALRAAEARLVQSKVKPQPPPRSTAKLIEALSPELQRRIVRKAFRKLGALNGLKVEEEEEEVDNDDEDDTEEDEDDTEPAAAAAAAAEEIDKTDARPKRDKHQQQHQQQHKEGDGCDESGEREREMTRRMRRARRMRRGLEGRRCAQSPPAPASAFAQRLETLVHVVISQDHTIRQQTQRLGQLDAEIEAHEARTHSDRVRQDGANYVQDAYALGHGHHPAANEAAATAPTAAGEGDLGAGDFDACSREEFEEYARVCGEVLALHGQLRARELAAERLDSELERAAERRSSAPGGGRSASVTRSPLAAEETREEEAAAAAYADWADAPELAAERLKSELGACAYIGFRMEAEARAATDELASSERTLRAMRREFERLVKNIERMEAQREQDVPPREQEARRAPAAAAHRTQFAASVCHQHPPPPPPLNAAVGKEFASGDADTRDDDSDTGLSSMHSQDSDTVVALESLV